MASPFLCDAFIHDSTPVYPGARHGLLGPTYQLKVIQESITLTVFAVLAYFYLDEAIRWNYVASFACLFGAVLFAFWSTF